MVLAGGSLWMTMYEGELMHGRREGEARLDERYGRKAGSTCEDVVDKG